MGRPIMTPSCVGLRLAPIPSLGNFLSWVRGQARNGIDHFRRGAVKRQQRENAKQHRANLDTNPGQVIA